jgi:hypothetical protein
MQKAVLILLSIKNGLNSDERQERIKKYVTKPT